MDEKLANQNEILSLIVCTMTSLTVHYISLYRTRDHISKAKAAYDLTVALKWGSIAAPIALLCGLCVRLSICLFLLRIFWMKRAWRWGLYAVMSFATAVIIPTIVSLLAQCSPVQKLWDPLLLGSCWSPHTVLDIGYFHGGEWSKIIFFIVNPNLKIDQEPRFYATGY